MNKKTLLTPVLPSWVILITACHVWLEILPRVLKNRRTQSGTRKLSMYWAYVSSPARSCRALFTPFLDATFSITSLIRPVASVSPKAHKYDKTVDKLSLFPSHKALTLLISCFPLFFISSSFSGVSISEFWQISFMFGETLCLPFWPLCFGVIGGAFSTFTGDGFKDSLRATWGRGWSLEGIVAGSANGVPRVISSCWRDNAPKSSSFRNFLRKPNLGSFSNELFWVCCRNKTARMPNDDATTTKSGTTLASNMDPSTCRRVALSSILNSSGKLSTTTFFRKYWHGLMPQRLELSRYQYLSREFSSSLITRVKGERPFLGTILPLTNNSWLKAG